MSDPAAFVEPIVTTRRFAATPGEVFRCFRDPVLLAQWWGPAGFTNTVTRFEFGTGGAWHIVMRGPDGTEYPNESRFTEIVEGERLVFEHLGPMHWYRMTMTFVPEAGGTRLTWRMLFATAEELAKVKEFVVPANEQNFDRLEACLEARS